MLKRAVADLFLQIKSDRKPGILFGLEFRGLCYSRFMKLYYKYVFGRKSKDFRSERSET
jgi:hypothetical protein